MKIPNLATSILMGLSFSISVLLLIVGYVPDFAPEFYERARRTGIITFVPVIAVVSFLSSFTWLWLSANKTEEDKDNE